MRVHWTILALSFLIFPKFSSYAQQKQTESCDVPVVVTHYDNQLAEDLVPKDFQVHVGGAQGTVEGLSIDHGPKWVGLILDASRNIPDNEWKLETRMAAELLDYARPGDKFFFMVIGTSIESDPLSDSGAVRDQVIKLMSSRPPVSDSTEKILDTVLDAVKRRDPAKFGDVLFLFGHHEDFGSSANADQTLDLMLQKKLRFFGMSFADPFAGKLPPGFDPNKPLPPSLGPTNLEEMALATGNYFSFHSAQILMDPMQMRLYEGFLGDLYARIANPYRLRIAVPVMQGQIKLEITVSNLQERKIRPDQIYYPHIIYSCTSPPSN